MVPLELGGDAGGSIPASFCGVYGHLSSFGVISLEGHGPPGGGVVAGRAWAAAGPMARTAGDLALAMEVLVGPEGRDARAWRLALPRPRHERLRDHRVLILTDHPTASVDGEIVAAIEALATGLEQAGAAVARKSELLPSLAGTQALVERFVAAATAARGPEGEPPTATVKDYFECLTAQEALRRQWDVFFRHYDVVIAPAYATPAYPLFETEVPWPGTGRTLVVDGEALPYAPQSAWPLMAGMPQLPATAAPIGRTRAGLPIGVQFIGPFLEDLTTIAFAAQVSDAFGLRAEIATPRA
jgi:amidase